MPPGCDASAFSIHLMPFNCVCSNHATADSIASTTEGGGSLIDIRKRTIPTLSPPLNETSSYFRDRKSTRLNSSHVAISYAVFCLKKNNKTTLLTATVHQLPLNDQQKH